MLECCSLGEKGSADNLSEFEVIVEAARDKILKKKKIKCSDKILGNHYYHKNSERTHIWNSSTTNGVNSYSAGQ